jgi:hypothetical protein
MAKARHHVQVPGGEDLDGDKVADDPEDPEERGADALDEKLNPHLDADVTFVSSVNNKKIDLKPVSRHRHFYHVYFFDLEIKFGIFV